MLLSAGILAVAGVSGADPGGKPANAAECRAQGGNWKKVGLRGVDECDLRTRDAGRACHDDSECESACVAADDTPAGSVTTGRCLSSTIVVGRCLNRVRDGKAFGLVCAD